MTLESFLNLVALNYIILKTTRRDSWCWPCSRRFVIFGQTCVNVCKQSAQAASFECRLRRSGRAFHIFVSKLLTSLTSVSTQRWANVEHGIETYDEERYISTEMVRRLRPGTHLELEGQSLGAHEWENNHEELNKPLAVCPLSCSGCKFFLIWYVFAFCCLRLFLTYKDISCNTSLDVILVRHNLIL